MGKVILAQGESLKKTLEEHKKYQATLDAHNAKAVQIQKKLAKAKAKIEQGLKEAGDRQKEFSQNADRLTNVEKEIQELKEQSQNLRKQFDTQFLPILFARCPELQEKCPQLVKKVDEAKKRNEEVAGNSKKTILTSDQINKMEAALLGVNAVFVPKSPIGWGSNKKN